MAYRVNWFYNAKKKNKYNAKRTEWNGHKYDSKKEAEYAMYLEDRKRAGEIKDWEPHPNLKIHAPTGEWLFNYRIDFLVKHHDGEDEYIEVKSAITAKQYAFTLKWRVTNAMLKYNYPDAILTLVK